MTDHTTAPSVHGDRDDLLWLAGLLEGEGSFDAQRGRYPRIRLAMTDRDVVGRAASLMDTSVRLSLHAKPAKPTWHAEIQGKRAASIMAEVLPHMGARRSQRIAEVLATSIEHATPGFTVRPGPAVTRPAGIAKPETAR